MRNLLIICLIAFLTGCASNPIIQQVLVPVPKKCNDKPIPDKPILFSDSKHSYKKLDEIINGYQTDIDKLEVYADNLKILICK